MQDLTPQLKAIIADLVFQIAALTAQLEAMQAENERLKQTGAQG